MLALETEQTMPVADTVEFFRMFFADKSFKQQYHAALGHSAISVADWGADSKSTTAFEAPFKAPEVIKRLLGLSKNPVVPCTEAWSTHQEEPTAPLTITSTTAFDGIPMAEHFHVSQTWTVSATPRGGARQVTASVVTRVSFTGKLLGARGTIEKQMYKDAEAALKIWFGLANSQINNRPPSLASADSIEPDSGASTPPLQKSASSTSLRVDVPTSPVVRVVNPESLMGDVNRALERVHYAPPTPDDTETNTRTSFSFVSDADSRDSLAASQEFTEPDISPGPSPLVQSKSLFGIETGAPTTMGGALLESGQIRRVRVTADAGVKEHTEYLFEITTAEGKFTVSRRYSRLRAAHVELAARFPAMPKFPKKRFLFKTDPAFVDTRCGDLQRYISEFVAMPHDRCFVMSESSVPHSTRPIPARMSPGLMVLLVLELGDIFDAISRRDEKLVRSLVYYGLPVKSVQNEVGETPLILACNMGLPMVANMLLEAGADPNLRDQVGGSALYYCAVAGLEAMVPLLIGREANLDAADDSGSTPLQVAAESGQVSIVKYLVHHGAQLDTRDSSGETPLSSAVAAFVSSVQARPEDDSWLGYLVRLTDVIGMLMAQGADPQLNKFVPGCLLGALEGLQARTDATDLERRALALVPRVLTVELQGAEWIANGHIDAIRRSSVALGAKALQQRELDMLLANSRRLYVDARHRVALANAGTKSAIDPAASPPPPATPSMAGGASPGGHAGAAVLIGDRQLLPMYTMPANPAAITGLRFAALNASLLGFSTVDGTITVVQLPEGGGMPVLMSKLCGDEAVLDFDWSSSNQQITSVSETRIQVWSVADGKSLRTMRSRGKLSCVRYHPLNNNIFVVGEVNNCIEAFNVSTGRCTQHIDVSGAVTCLSFDCAGHLLFAGDTMGNIYQLQFDIKTCKAKPKTRSLVCKGSAINAIDVYNGYETDNGQTTALVLATCGDNQLRMYTVTATGLDLIREIPMMVNRDFPARARAAYRVKSIFCRLARNASSLHVVSGSEDALIHVLDVHHAGTEGTEVTIASHQAAVTDVSWNRVLGVLASSDARNQIRLWRVVGVAT